MPIPPLKNNRKQMQGWRDQKPKNNIPGYKKASYLNNSRAANSSSGRPTNTKKSKKSNSRIKNWLKNWKKTLVVSGILVSLAGIMIVGIFISWLSRNLPDPDRLMSREMAQSTKIYDRTGETVLYEIHGDKNRTLVTLDQIPDHLEQATITIEDKDFYNHQGFSLWAIARTVVTNVLYQRKAGASTLTQQLMKNAVLTTEKTYTRKIKEVILAYRAEKVFSKKEILQMYLNEIPYGSTAYGVDAASRLYFGKPVQEITLAESAVLAALPQAPSTYSPYGSNKDLLVQRQHYILDLMVEQGHISNDQAQSAKEEELVFREPKIDIKAPHFVMYVKELLAAKYGEKMIEQGGLKIYTTLDIYKQDIAQEIIAEQAAKNQDDYNASNAALLSVDPKTGQILAMVGSRDYFDDEIDGQVNITTSQRQPGSSMKPLVYAASYLRGYTPETVLYDVVTNFSTQDGESYEPHNYDLEEHGPISMRKALAGSLNIPAVKAIYLAGVNNVLDLAEDFGYTTFSDRDRFGLSLVLGGGEVKMIEHVNAYSAFAREGLLSPLSVILKVENADGDVLEEFEQEQKQVIDPKIARMINNVLSDNSARAFTYGESNWLTLGSRPVAAKTGTTNDYRDAWTIGYTPSLVTGVWVGNNDNSEMKRGAAGGSVAAPIWNKYMKRILGDTPVEYFKEPEIPKREKPMLNGDSGAGTEIKIDKSSGLLATEHTPEHLIEIKTFSDPHCILHYVDKNDPLGPEPEDPSLDPQYNLWEASVRAWAEENNLIGATSSPPTQTDNLHKPENRPKVKIIKPKPNKTLTDSLFVVDIETTAPRGIDRAEYYLNGNLLSINQSYPFNLQKNISFLNNGYHNLEVRVCDDVDNCTSVEREFNLLLNRPPGQTVNASISLSYPTRGLAVTNMDFPLPLQVKMEGAEQIASIKFYNTPEGSQEAQLIDTGSPAGSSEISASWQSTPPSGSYTIYAQATKWSGEKINSDEVLVIVNNINPQNSTSTSQNN
jgi:1A family penicillin-binding protein